MYLEEKAKIISNYIKDPWNTQAALTDEDN